MFTVLQRIGRSLMLPIAVLPAAGIRLRFGQPDLLNIPFLADAGGAIFGNLSLLFAIGVAVGFTSGAGVAGVAAAVSYWVFTTVLVDISGAVYGEPGAQIDMGVLAGILMGLMAAWLYERYHTIQLPEWLAFFGGSRFVPIVSAFAALVGGIGFGLVWYWPEQALTAVGHWAIEAGPVGSSVHAFLNRLLIPFGLHHVINSIVWFEFGDLTMFFETRGAQGGLFMTGFFPIFLFGLPAAALAMYMSARTENRKAVGGILFSASLTSIITGITEPIEFAFMFVAPVLYVLHAVLTGISSFVVISLELRHGFTFSAGLIDYLLNFGIASNPLLLLAVGVVFGVIYYVVFTAVIRALNVPTPGREPKVAEE
jgi:PTS system N-acetylglucosamine-specific IIC component